MECDHFSPTFPVPLTKCAELPRHHPTAGTTPLYRMFKPSKPDHFYAHECRERDFTAAHGYRLETIAGYVGTATVASDRNAGHAIIG